MLLENRWGVLAKSDSLAGAVMDAPGVCSEFPSQMID